MQARSDKSGGSSGNALETPFRVTDAPDVQQQTYHFVAEMSVPEAAERGFSPLQVYAAAIYLLSRSDQHRAMPLGLADTMIREVLKLGQLKLYYKDNAPVALALWAYLDEQVEKRLLSGGARLKPEELKVGDRLWTVAVVTPFGGADVVREDLATTLFKATEYRELGRTQLRSDGPFAISPVASAVSYRPARRDDVAALAPRLRQQDRMELLAATGRDAATALTDSFDNSKRCWSMLHNGQVIAMFGVGRIHNRPQDGRIWMLGSDELFRQGRALLCDGPVWVREMMKGHTALGNFVDARNESYIRWLKRLGFRFVRLHEQFGLQKHPFWEFFITPTDVGAAAQSPRGQR